VQQAVADGLVAAGWDVVRAIDAFPGGTPDAVLFEHAAKEGRVFVTNDEDLLAIGAARSAGMGARPLRGACCSSPAFDGPSAAFRGSSAAIDDRSQIQAAHSGSTPLGSSCRPSTLVSTEG
jgi:hypothetical protein